LKTNGLKGQESFVSQGVSIPGLLVMSYLLNECYLKVEMILYIRNE